MFHMISRSPSIARPPVRLPIPNRHVNGQGHTRYSNATKITLTGKSSVTLTHAVVAFYGYNAVIS